MKGKILKVFNNDLYGKVDERIAVVFATFIHKKYMNRYAIFIFENEYNLNKLYYGSVHIKENSLVIFKVKPELISVFNDFLIQYTNNQLIDYELIDITNLNKIEIVGFNEMPYENLLLLDNLSIKKEEIITNSNHSQNTFTLKIIIPIIILLAGAIGTYLYLNPSLFQYQVLICSRDSYNQKLKLDFKENLTVIFDGKNNLKQYDVKETYYFKNQSSYQEFVDNGKQYIYFDADGKTFDFNNKNLTLVVTYKRNSDINDFSKMKYQLEQDGYNCTEDNYEK